MASNTPTISASNWDATFFFQKLTAMNRLAREKNFYYFRVSGLEGFEEALSSMQSVNNFVCVSDIADGFIQLNNTPRTRRVKTIFFAMRHAVDNMDARAECFTTMQDLFRQFMSALILQRIKLEEQCIYVDPHITFNEIDRYFFTGCACAYFQVAVDKFTDLRFNRDEWIPNLKWDEDEHDYRPHIEPFAGRYFNLIDNGETRAKTLTLIRQISGCDITTANNITRNLPASCKILGTITSEQTETIISSLLQNKVVYSITDSPLYELY